MSLLLSNSMDQSSAVTSSCEVYEAEAHFVSLHPPLARRQQGVTFTPQWIVDLMVNALRSEVSADTLIVDVGAGAGRFCLTAARTIPDVEIQAVEKDSSLAQALRRQIADNIFASCIRVKEQDFLRCSFQGEIRRKVYLGNPPYIRHHSIAAEDKSWLQNLGKSLKRKFSGLSGMHIYFLLHCLSEAKAGDRLLMILPTEWLESNYGIAVKEELVRRCSLVKLYLFPSQIQVFGETMTTSVILDAIIGAEGGAVLSAAAISEGADELPSMTSAITHPLSDLSRINWLRAAYRAISDRPPEEKTDGHDIELGQLFGVHRGQVTGMNDVWIANDLTRQWIPERFLIPSITDAREIIDLPDALLSNVSELKRVIELPADLSVLSGRDRRGVDKFLDYAQKRGAADTYVARHRSPWWRVDLKKPPTIVMSYMARRAPRFALNVGGARLLNIAHGLYPRASLTRGQAMEIVSWLNSSDLSGAGRTYAGGLIKFEPGDACRIRIPRLQQFGLPIAA